MNSDSPSAESLTTLPKTGSAGTPRIPMKPSSITMLIFSVYMALLCVVFVFFPDAFARSFGFPTPNGPWLRILGMIFGILTFYYAMAIKEEATAFYRWTAYGRLAIFPSFVGFVLMGWAPSIILIFGAWDSACGLWTAIALRRENKYPEG